MKIDANLIKAIFVVLLLIVAQTVYSYSEIDPEQEYTCTSK